jgi:superfamily II DNA/RNA helicase
MTSFTELGLTPIVLNALDRMGYSSMTPIQAAAIPFILSGRDVLGSAQTGTGKTAAFAVPLVAKLLKTQKGTALVMTPTRELAVQVLEVIKQLLPREIKTALLIGGEAMPPQFNQLRMNPRVIVGTPGRINDHLERQTLRLHDADFLVLDEADRMLDMGFDVQIEQIIKSMPKMRQTVMFSATMPKNIVRLSNQYLQDPEHVAIGSTTTPLVKIKQEIIHTSEINKYDDLVKELDKRQGSIIVFVKTKIRAEKLSSKLSKNNHSTDTIHGDLRQHKRTRVILAFRKKQYRIMVATDVAARGLDIPHIEHVINYDLPQCAEDYIHRLGRTARAGAEGSAVSLIVPEDGKKWNAINQLMNPGSVPQRSGNGGAAKRSSSSRPFERSRRPATANSNEASGGGGRDYSNSERKYFSSDRKKPANSGFGGNAGGGERKYFSADRKKPGNSESTGNAAGGERKYFSSDRKKSGAAGAGNSSYNPSAERRSESRPVWSNKKK